jgi:acetyltransferase-like isoleucine patch superfamily enzyme
VSDDPERLPGLRGVVQRARYLATEPMARAVLRGAVQRPYRRRQFAAFGDNSLIDRPLWVYGAHHIAIGRNVLVLAHAWLSAERESWDRSEPAIEIGDGSILRTNVVISAAAGVVIERNVAIGAACSIVDNDHQVIPESGMNPVWNPQLSEPIRIGEGSWLAERVTVTRGARIGRHCVIGAHSVVRGEIPDGSVAAGVPAKVISQVG